jgi:phosphoribosylformimino-5-aminoimidazole carboxamide ribotide isomerase
VIKRVDATREGGLRPFEVVPAVDVLGGRAVRLASGQRNQTTLEGGDPVELAGSYAEQGAARIHLVDLDGAFSGRPSPGLVASVVARTGLPVQIGGGYRSLDAIAAAIDAGADRVMVGTAAVEPGFLARAVERFGDALLVAVDARDGLVATEGWQATAPLAPGVFAQHCARAGVCRLLVTSTCRDGMLQGPDLALVEEVRTCGLPVLAAGGIASVADLLALRAAGCEGAVVGSALLAGRFRLADALAALAVA